MLLESNSIGFILSKSGIKTNFNIGSFMEYINNENKLSEEDTIPFIAYSACCIFKMYQDDDVESITKSIDFASNYNFFEEFWKISVVIGHEFHKTYPDIVDYLINNYGLSKEDINRETK